LTVDFTHSIRATKTFPIYLLLSLAVASAGAGSSFAPGDLIIGGRPGYAFDGGKGFVQKYGPGGLFEQYLIAANGSHPRDMIDLNGVLIVADQDHLTRITPDGVASLAAPVFFGNFVSSLAADASQNIYVGDFLDSVLTKLSPSGALVQQWTLPAIFREIVGMDLQPDQCTLLYVTTAPVIQRYDVCVSSALADFARIPSGAALSIRILSNGHVLVTSTTGVFHFDKDGNLLGSYAAGLIVRRLSLVPGENRMWVITNLALIEQIDLDSGNVIIGPMLQDQPVPGVGFGGEALIVVGDRRVAQSSAVGVPTLLPFVILILIGTLAVVGSRRL
jgi:hypothetical protein